MAEKSALSQSVAPSGAAGETSWSRYLGIDFGHPWPKSPRKRAAMFAAAVLVAAPAPARLKESGLRS
ncbi:MAG: hypothetical protein GY782_01035, partial [Gammaproteobacteria bacterium]|nr:hypothetical protein [Gammaproteobacteria bacterium]